MPRHRKLSFLTTRGEVRAPKFLWDKRFSQNCVRRKLRGIIFPLADEVKIYPFQRWEPLNVFPKLEREGVNKQLMIIPVKQVGLWQRVKRGTSFNLRLNGPRPSKVEASCRILRKQEHAQNLTVTCTCAGKRGHFTQNVVKFVVFIAIKGWVPVNHTLVSNQTTTWKVLNVQ